jgi:hypothetical protein
MSLKATEKWIREYTTEGIVYTRIYHGRFIVHIQKKYGRQSFWYCDLTDMYENRTIINYRTGKTLKEVKESVPDTIKVSW